MNPYQFESTCDVCGGAGLGRAKDLGATWDSNARIRHSDPRTCAAILAKRKKELDEREKNLST